MEKIRATRKIKYYFFLCTFFAIIVCMVSLYSTIKVNGLRKINAQTNEKILGMNKQQNKLQEEINYMKTDEYLDIQARNEYEMIKDNETIYYYN